MCYEQVNLKKDRIVQHIQSTKHQTRKEKYIQSLQQGKSVTKFLDTLDAGEVTGASAGALQSPKGFGSRTSEEARIWRIELVSWWMKCGLSLNSLNVFAPFLEKYAQRVPDASHLRQLIPIIHAQELERVKKALQGRSISIIFDGTTRVCEAFAVVARYIDEERNIRQM